MADFFDPDGVTVSTPRLPARNPGDVYGFDNPNNDPGQPGEAFYDPLFVPITEIPGVTLVPTPAPTPPPGLTPLLPGLGLFALGGMLGVGIGAYLYDYLHPPVVPFIPDIDPETGLLREVIVQTPTTIPIETLPFDEPLTQPSTPLQPPNAPPSTDVPFVDDPYGRPYSDDPFLDPIRFPNPRVPLFPPQPAPQTPGRIEIDPRLTDPYGLGIPDAVAQPSPTTVSQPVGLPFPFPGVAPYPLPTPADFPLPSVAPDPLAFGLPFPTPLTGGGLASPLTLFDPGGVGSPLEDPALSPPRAGTCQCVDAPQAPKQKKKKQPRTVCYEGKFREYANGTSKFSQVEVPCEAKPKAARKKRPKYPPGNPFPGLPQLPPLRGI